MILLITEQRNVNERLHEEQPAVDSMVPGKMRVGAIVVQLKKKTLKKCTKKRIY